MSTDPPADLPRTSTGRARFLAACRRQPVDRPPVWLMRQAGRYMAEYQAIRAKHEFLEVCRSPTLASEVTLQPIRRFGMDAAIIFSDILVVPEAMGQRVTYPEGGPRLEPPVRSAADLARLTPLEPAATLTYVSEALERVRDSLQDETALLGFAGAPYTLATYMIEGGGSRHHAETKRIAFSQPELLDDLLALLADGVARFLSLQLDAGADAVQIFDTWAGDLAPPDFERFALAPVRRVIQSLTGHGAPVIYFVNGIASHLEAAASSGASVLGIDWRMDLAEARRRTGGRVALQGNLDPLILLAPPEVISSRVRRIHRDLERAPGHIFNLGHGVLPFIPPEGVDAFVKAVQELGHD